MKMMFTVFGAAVMFLLLFFLINCKGNSSAKDESIIDNKDTIHTKENHYSKLRKIAFSITPEQLGLQIPDDKTLVYGIVMDWEMEGATATTVSYQTGDASLYLSSGAAVIGGGKHPNVNSAAKQFVDIAQVYLDKTTKTEEASLPETNYVKFYFLTNKGIYTAQEQVKNFESNSSSWLRLFEEGNNVLTELRKVSEK